MVVEKALALDVESVYRLERELVPGLVSLLALALAQVSVSKSVQVLGLELVLESEDYLDVVALVHIPMV